MSFSGSFSPLHDFPEGCFKCIFLNWAEQEVTLVFLRGFLLVTLTQRSLAVPQRVANCLLCNTFFISGKKKPVSLFLILVCLLVLKIQLFTTHTDAKNTFKMFVKACFSLGTTGALHIVWNIIPQFLLNTLVGCISCLCLALFFFVCQQFWTRLLEAFSSFPPRWCLVTIHERRCIFIS